MGSVDGVASTPASPPPPAATLQWKPTGSSDQAGFDIFLNGERWLSSAHDGAPVVGGSSGLELVDTFPEDGSDAFGDFHAVHWSWGKAGSTNDTATVLTSIRSYSADPGMLVFEQFFPSGLDAPSAISSGSLVSTLWPSFAKPAGSSSTGDERAARELSYVSALALRDLACFCYEGVSCCRRSVL